MLVAIINLGCAKNQVDSEIMSGLLKAQGYSLVANPTQATIVIVNSCCFIAAAKEESVNAILRAAQLKEAKCHALIITGCLSQRYGQELLEEIPEIDAVVGTGSFPDICSVISRVLGGERVLALGDINYALPETIERLPTGAHSVYVKIAEGCDHRCSYCVIPSVRGTFRSRSMDSIVSEVESLVNGGATEVNLVAQDSTRYGLDLYGASMLPELLRRIAAIQGLGWLRVLYCYPAGVTTELLVTMAELSQVCKYIDLPLQHVNARVLHAMNRRGTPEETRRMLKHIREIMPEATIRTTFIVGFPGETEHEFTELLHFVAEGWFDHAGVFQYSPEEGTVAEALGDQIPPRIKQRRHDELMAVQQEVSRKRNSRFLGQAIEVIVDEPWPKGHGVKGRAAKDAPGVDGAVFVRGIEARRGEFLKVLVERTSEYDLWGSVSE